MRRTQTHTDLHGHGTRLRAGGALCKTSVSVRVFPARGIGSAQCAKVYSTTLAVGSTAAEPPHGLYGELGAPRK